MNNFDKILNQKTTELLEYTTNPAIKQAVKALEKGLQVSGQVNSDPNAKALASELFGVSKEGENPLQSAFKKIQDNPENPNLSYMEIQAYLKLAEKINPEQKKEETEEKEGTTGTTTGTAKSSQSTKTSQQPNANQYNPLTQK